MGLLDIIGQYDAAAPQSVRRSKEMEDYPVIKILSSGTLSFNRHTLTKLGVTESDLVAAKNDRHTVELFVSHSSEHNVMLVGKPDKALREAIAKGNNVARIIKAAVPSQNNVQLNSTAAILQLIGQFDPNEKQVRQLHSDSYEFIDNGEGSVLMVKQGPYGQNGK